LKIAYFTLFSLQTCPLTREDLFASIREEALSDSRNEPTLASMLYATILSHDSLTYSISFVLANKLGNQDLHPSQLVDIFRQAFDNDPPSKKAMQADLCAVYERDPACDKYSQCLLYFKGFQAIQAYRVAHWLWTSGRKTLALALQSRISEVFQVDIHPAARIGSGILLDHATGVVIGETAVVGDNVSILHNVTLGGTGAQGGDRHPKVGDGVLIGAGVSILGNVKIGEGSKIGAGSVVLKEVPPHETAVGVPAKLLKAKKLVHEPSMDMDQTSFADYMI